MGRDEDFGWDALRIELGRYSVDGFSPAVVVVKTKTDGLDARIVTQHLKQYPIRHTAGSRIAVLLPSLLVHGDVGQHIYRCFKQI